LAKIERIKNNPMNVTLRCHPLLVDILPRPTLAKLSPPTWIKDMPSEVHSTTLGEPIRTLKHCPPILDAMALGILFPLSTDVHVTDSGFHWDWDPPQTPETLLTRSPLSLHLVEQAQGTPFDTAPRHVIKFNNFWTVELPRDTSMAFFHPINRPELPFQTLSGVVDCDLFSDGYVHFPALWTDHNFRGTLPAGTPIAQGIIINRAPLVITVEEQSPDQIARAADLQKKLGTERGVYRKHFRSKNR
jgi:hypothetical protein